MVKKEGNFGNENAIGLVGITDRQKKYEDGLVSQVTEETPLVLLTDLEGPILAGDTAMEAMKKFVPKGEELYDATYKWYTEHFYNPNSNLDLGQEAGDIIMALPTLLAYGVTGEHILEIAKESKQINGSQSVIDLVKREGGLVFGVTSAWSQHHRPITEQIGVNGLFGTEFPVDEVREKFETNRTFQLEMENVRRFIERFILINNPAVLTREVDCLIGDFFVNTLGIKFVNSDARERSLIGSIVNQLKVIGDKGKLATFETIKRKKPTKLIAMGDGLNDKLMLTESDWSIGVNGPKAVEGAKLGVITDDMGVVADIIKLIASGVSNPNEVVEVFKTNNRAIVHLGGEDIPDSLVEKHKEMRKKIRGDAANFG